MLLEDAVKTRDELVGRLISQRKPAGYWEGTLSSDTQATAAAAIALHLAGREAQAARAVGHLLTCRNADGGCGHIRGAPSDLDSSNSAFAAILLCGTEEHRQHLETLGAFRRSRAPSVGALSSRVLLHVAGVECDIVPPAVDVERLPFPERMMLGMIRAYLAREAEPILALGHLVNGERSWRGLVTVSAIASAFLSRCGHRDDPALRWLLRFQNADGGFPHTHSLGVWDTVIASLALLDAGHAPRSDAWLLSQQDEGGGWCWDAERRSSLDCDDTGYALWVLLRTGHRRDSDPVRRAMAMLRDCQGPEGGFPSFEKAGRVHERAYWNVSVPDVTAHVLQALKAAGMSAEAARAEDWLLSKQTDGLWKGFWFKGDLYSTVSVLEAIDKSRVNLGDVRKRILTERRPDGGFGRGGRSTIEETAWGAAALLEAEAALAEVAPSVEWLVERCADPTPAPVGALPLFDKYYSDSMFPLAFGLAALEKYVARVGVAPRRAAIEVVG